MSPQQLDVEVHKYFDMLKELINQKEIAILLVGYLLGWTLKEYGLVIAMLLILWGISL